MEMSDLTHGSLMELQELDKHLAIFESAGTMRDPTTPGAISVSTEGGTISSTDQNPHTILVDPFGANYPTKYQSELIARALSYDRQSVPKIITQAKRSPEYLANGKLRLQPKSGRDSIASSMTTDLDDNSSELSSISSKATSPTGFDAGPRDTQKVKPQAGNRKVYDIRPKISIPTDITASEYSRQCISAAESSRLFPNTLHTEELAMLRKHISHQQVTTYLSIRNGILRLWTRNPLIGVLRDEAIGCAKDARWFDVARICHEWLVRRGYINYGCLDHSSRSASEKDSRKARPAKRKRRTVVVIGAGLSGLGCARQLEGLFAQFEDRFSAMNEDLPRVVVLEGRDRVGGRVYSRAFKSKVKRSTLSQGSRHTAEMGGMIITGFDRGNPLNIIVRGQLALPYYPLKPDTTIYDATGRPVDTHRDQFAEKLFNYILDRVSEYKFKPPVEPTVDGDRDLLEAGRDASGEGQKMLSELENIGTAQPQVSPSIDVQMIPVSSDRLTGRAHLEPGIPGVHTAAYKAKEIGWTLKDGVGIEFDLDLESAVSSKYATLGSVIDEAIRQYSRIVDFAPLDLRLINWHIANLEYSNAITTNRLSLGGWDLDAGNEWDGKHTMVVGGYQQVPRGLLNCPRPLNVHKKSTVKRVQYSPDGTGSVSRVECEDGEIIDADYIVSTMPLGVLKSQDVEFVPPLPDWKAGAIQRLGFGVLNKVVLVYNEAFWDSKRDIFGFLRNSTGEDGRFSILQRDYFSERGRFFQWFNCTKTSGAPTLLALMAGDAAFQTEKATNEDLIEEATAILRSIFGTSVPKPVEAIVTRWGHDKFAHGSYSYAGANFKHDDYDVMSKQVGNLFFAGEHTAGKHPATVHGAYLSGLRAASEVLEAILGPIDIPEPLVLPKDSSSKRKAETVQSPKDPKRAREEAYEIEIWNAIWTALGDRPFRPANNQANAYRLYSKEKWEDAKRKCEEGRRPGKGKPIPNEVKKMVTKMYKEASEDEKKPFNERANVEKVAYAAAMKEYNEKAAKWDREAMEIRTQYVKDHPSVPGPEESSESPRNRKAKRVSGYAEESGSEMEA